MLSLLELHNFGKWIDGKVGKIHPEGQIVVGQEAIISAEAFMLTWKVRIKVISIDKANHRIRYNIFDPFGLKNEEELQYSRLPKTICEVRYNYNFIFQDGIKGFILKIILGRKMIETPSDSIKRLKAKAKSEYRQYGYNAS